MCVLKRVITLQLSLILVFPAGYQLQELSHSFEQMAPQSFMVVQGPVVTLSESRLRVLKTMISRDRLSLLPKFKYASLMLNSGVKSVAHLLVDEKGELVAEETLLRVINQLDKITLICGKTNKEKKRAFEAISKLSYLIQTVEDLEELITSLESSVEVTEERNRKAARLSLLDGFSSLSHIIQNKEDLKRVQVLFISILRSNRKVGYQPLTFGLKEMSGFIQSIEDLEKIERSILKSTAKNKKAIKSYGKDIPLAISLLQGSNDLDLLLDTIERTGLLLKLIATELFPAMEHLIHQDRSNFSDVLDYMIRIAKGLSFHNDQDIQIAAEFFPEVTGFKVFEDLVLIIEATGFIGSAKELFQLFKAERDRKKLLKLIKETGENSALIFEVVRMYYSMDQDNIDAAIAFIKAFTEVAKESGKWVRLVFWWGFVKNLRDKIQTAEEVKAYGAVLVKIAQSHKGKAKDILQNLDQESIFSPADLRDQGSLLTALAI